MPNFAESSHGFAVVCDSAGRIARVLRNDLCDGVVLEEHASLSTIVEPNSLQKYLSFMQHLREEQAVYRWSVNTVCHGSVVELHLVGGTNDDEFLIVGSISHDTADQWFSEIMRINNEHVNYIRTTSKTTSKLPGSLTAGDVPDEDVYQDFMRLNNELSNLQRDLQKKNQKLQHTVNERDRYIGMAAHDLRNPLGGFSSVCRLLLDEAMGPLTADQREAVELMRESAEHMLSMVSDMLDITTIQSGTLKLNRTSVDMHRILTNTLAIHRQLAKTKQIRIDLDAADDLPPVWADAVKISQVLDNLVSNAVKYSYPESVITVRVFQQADMVAVDVEDQGQGIPGSELHKLFVPYAKLSVKPTAGETSTGLGLAISKKTVEGHGGELSVDSREGEGSTFRFTIPVDA